MGFWSFMRDMFVLDWLFGHHKKESSGESSQGESQRYTDFSDNDDYLPGGFDDYSQNDYARQDFDDDLDAGMFDDDF